MMDFKFSIIIAIDDDNKKHRELIKTVQSQRYTGLEIIIVSNRLNTRDQFIVDFLVLQNNLDRCKHLSLITRGCKGSLYNVGITCATGDYVWCIDENVSLQSEWSITKIVNELKKSKAQVVHLEKEDHVTTKMSHNHAKKASNITHDAYSKLISRKDWDNPSRLILHKKFIELFDVKFVEGWSHTNGAFAAIQIMRSTANISFFKPENVEFTKDQSKKSTRELIEHLLSLNYLLRYSEIVYRREKFMLVVYSFF